MPKQKYRLETVLVLREKKKEETERYLGDCLRTLKIEQDKLAQMEAELERMIEERHRRVREHFEQAMRGEVQARSAVHQDRFIDRMKEQEKVQKSVIENQKLTVQSAERDVEDARKEVVKATQDFKALEKHKEKWAEALKKEQQTKEEETLDEIGQGIFFRRDR